MVFHGQPGMQLILVSWWTQSDCKPVGTLMEKSYVSWDAYDTCKKSKITSVAHQDMWWSKNMHTSATHTLIPLYLKKKSIA